MSFAVSPSLSAGSQLHLEETLRALSGLEHLHLDVDDGNFVHGITFGLDTVRIVAENTTVPVDVHLEVSNPLDYVDELGRIGVWAACAHVEALPFPSEFLGAARAAGIERRGLALNLKTPVETLLPYAREIDYVIIVSVEADREGLRFRPGALDKISRARKVLPHTCDVWADGAIRSDNLPAVAAAGADGVVVGRAVFDAVDPLLASRELATIGEQERRSRR